MVLNEIPSAGAEAVTPCHPSVNADLWALLVSQIDTRWPKRKPPMFCERFAALHIAASMAVEARKSGVRAYRYSDVLDVADPALDGPYSRDEEGPTGRTEILFELAALPFIQTHQERGAKYIRLVL